MNSRASPSNDVAVAGRQRSTEDSVEKPAEKRVNSSKTNASSSKPRPLEASHGEEAKGRGSKNDTEDLSPSGSTGRSLKAGQKISPRFPSSSRVVHGIEDGGGGHRRRRGRDWFRHGARCVCRISNRTTGGRVVSVGGCSFPRRARSRRENERRLALRRRRRQPRKQLLDSAAGAPSVARTVAQSSRKRRVGIVENRYVVETDGGPSSVCELARDLERLFGERGASGAMRSKKQQDAEAETAVDPVEANETYDEFDTVRMPVVRSLSKSPQSDEGIEADPERRRGSVARCWSLDSAAASDEDAALTAHQFKRHKLRVTRCCSSDSAVLSDEDQIKGWDGSNMVEGSESENHEGRPRYWRTPSVVVSDYSDYSYLDEKLERNDLELEKYDGTSGTPSQASSCSCLDCDEIRESLDNQFLQVCRSRRHSDSCCLCLDSASTTANRNINEGGSRRNSCLDTTNSYYSKLDSQFLQYTQDDTPELQEKTKVEFLDIPPARKISDCSTSSLSGDESDVPELQQVKPSRVYKYFNTVTLKEKPVFSTTSSMHYCFSPLLFVGERARNLSYATARFCSNL
ncbi:uncharacterized protein LOC143185191 [Calliopsis andreniformis]|uniref:uncharacterized protein LOC143185191 n=1 Tax=Calliopsis andreniformis TaxID=337506 RepID=UPI003FCE10EB